jgi:hypothetical protein
MYDGRIERKGNLLQAWIGRSIAVPRNDMFNTRSADGYESERMDERRVYKRMFWVH